MEIKVGDIWQYKKSGDKYKIINANELADEVTVEALDGSGIYTLTVIFITHCFVRVSGSSKAADILTTAAEVMVERGKSYDGSGQERSMAKIVASFNAKTGHNLTELEGWLFMTDLKAVRALNGGGMDCFVDGAAYFALAGESVSE